MYEQVRTVRSSVTALLAGVILDILVDGFNMVLQPLSVGRTRQSNFQLYQGIQITVLA